MGDPSDAPGSGSNGPAETAAEREVEQVVELERRIEELAGRGGVATLVGKDTLQGSDILTLLGGVRGLVETIVPGLLFVIAFAVGQTLSLATSESLATALSVSLGSAVIFVAIRLLQRGPSRAAIAGLLGAAASAAIALLTGNPSDNFLPGIIINAVYGVAMLVSVLLRWPLIGMVVGVLMSDGVHWRSDPRRYRAMVWLTLLWAGLFAIRLAVEVPLYLAGPAGIVALGLAKLVLGTPLYALFVVFTWLIARGVFPKSQSSGD